MHCGIVVPSYNEAENIGMLLTEICSIVPSATIVVVDDSPDNTTVESVESLHNSQVHVIHRTHKDGRGSAVIVGLEYLLREGADLLIEMDADFSHPPRQLPELIRTLEEKKLAMLIASRYLPYSRIENWSVARRVFSKCANFVARLLLQVPIADYTNGYRAYSRSSAELIVKHCGRMGKGFIPLSEIVTQLYYRGFPIGEIPTHFVNRARGQSSLNITEIKNAVTGIIKIFGLRKRLQKEFSRTKSSVS